MVDQRAVTEAMKALGRKSKTLREGMTAAIEAYEAAKWRPIEEAPHQQLVLTLWQSGCQEVMYKTEYGPPLVSTWRFSDGRQGPWPTMFRTIDRPKQDEAKETPHALTE